MNDNESIKKAAKFINDRVLIHEKWILLIIIVVTALNIAVKNSFGFLAAIVFNIAAIIYFFSSFIAYLYPQGSKIDQFYIKLVGFGSSITLIGILFKLMHYPNNELFLKIGLITQAIILAFVLLQKVRKSELLFFIKILPYRIIILLGISILLYILKA